MFYGDGVTVANPIGVYRNNSKVMLMYWGMMLPGPLSSNPLAARSAAPDTAALCVAVILSVRPEHRLSLHNIHLATIAMENHIAWYGAERVVSGELPSACSSPTSRA